MVRGASVPKRRSADLAPDGAIVRLYAAYTPEGLDHAIAAAALAATGITTDPPGLHAPIIYAETLTPPQTASTSQPSALLTSIRIGPERGDYSWVVAAALTIMALATQRGHVLKWITSHLGVS